MPQNVHTNSLNRSIAIGSVAFCLASLCVFATVAFAERWMYRQLGLAGAYVAWIALFILLGGSALGPLVSGRWRLPRFYLLFGVAFFAYGVGWFAAYVLSPGLVGESLGLLAGSILMGLVLAFGFRVMRRTLTLSLIILAANLIGYFCGSSLNNALHGRTGMLVWGIIYGLCFGAGLGAVLHLAQIEAEQ